MPSDRAWTGGGPPAATRAELARVAARAAATAAGVAGLSAGTPPVYVTDVEGERLEGVSVVASEPGRYEVTVCLVALPIDLHRLADDVRDRVREHARIAGLDAWLGAIAVRVHDLVASAPEGSAP